MTSQAVEQLSLPVLMPELLTDDGLLMSFLFRKYSRDVDVVLMLQPVKVRWEEILKLEFYVHVIVPGYSDEGFRRHFRLRRGTVEIRALKRTGFLGKLRNTVIRCNNNNGSFIFIAP